MKSSAEDEDPVAIDEARAHLEATTRQGIVSGYGYGIGYLEYTSNGICNYLGRSADWGAQQGLRQAAGC